MESGASTKYHPLHQAYQYVLRSKYFLINFFRRFKKRQIANNGIFKNKQENLIYLPVLIIVPTSFSFEKQSYSQMLHKFAAHHYSCAYTCICLQLQPISLCRQPDLVHLSARQFRTQPIDSPDKINKIN